MPPFPPWFALALLGVSGLLFGSFANVVIWRFPRGESLSNPPSHCPRCGHPVRWYDNVPVVSWVALGGRCRDCGEPIAWRYPAVEALSAVLWVAAGLAFGWSLRTVWAVFFFYVLLILAFIDLDLRRLPNVLVGILAAVGLAGALVSQFSGIPAAPLVGGGGGGFWGQPLVLAVLGAVLGAGLSLAISLVYALVRRRQGLGMGDVKLLGAMGLFLGPYVLFAYLAGTLVGAMFAIVALAARPKPSAGDRAAAHMTIPFGPWLAVGAVLTALWGPAAWAWYAGVSRLG